MNTKKIASMLGASLMAMLVILTPVLGATTEQSTDPVLVPGHPLYFMKTAYEGIHYTFTFGEENKYQFLQELMQERNHEMTVLRNRGDTQNLEKMQTRLQTQSIIMTNLKTQIGISPQCGNGMGC